MIEISDSRLQHEAERVAGETGVAKEKATVVLRAQRDALVGPNVTVLKFSGFDQQVSKLFDETETPASDSLGKVQIIEYLEEGNHGIATRVLEKTNVQELGKFAVELYQSDKPEYRNLREQLGNPDIGRLTPFQAAAIATAIPAIEMRYLPDEADQFETLQKFFSEREEKFPPEIRALLQSLHNDYDGMLAKYEKTPREVLLENEQKNGELDDLDALAILKSKMGVCRHTAIVAHCVYDSLKQLQTDKELVDSYLLYTVADWNAYHIADTERHAFNTLLILRKNDSLACVTDPTKLGDYQREKILVEDADTTPERIAATFKVIDHFAVQMGIADPKHEETQILRAAMERFKAIPDTPGDLDRFLALSCAGMMLTRTNNTITNTDLATIAVEKTIDMAAEQPNSREVAKALLAKEALYCKRLPFSKSLSIVERAVALSGDETLGADIVAEALDFYLHGMIEDSIRERERNKIYDLALKNEAEKIIEGRTPRDTHLLKAAMLIARADLQFVEPAVLNRMLRRVGSALVVHQEIQECAWRDKKYKTYGVVEEHFDSIYQAYAAIVEAVTRLSKTGSPIEIPEGMAANVEKIKLQNWWYGDHSLFDENKRFIKHKWDSHASDLL